LALTVLYPDGPCGAHTGLGLGAGFQSVSHFSSGVIYLHPIYKFCQSYFCKTTEGNRVATRSLRAYVDLQSFLMSGDDRRPELDSQIPNLGLQRVGMKNIFRAGNRSDIFPVGNASTET